MPPWGPDLENKSILFYNIQLCDKSISRLRRPFNKGHYQVLLPAYNGLWFLLILKSVV